MEVRQQHLSKYPLCLQYQRHPGYNNPAALDNRDLTTVDGVGHKPYLECLRKRTSTMKRGTLVVMIQYASQLSTYAKIET
jgi:hypothetical protein